LRAGKWGAGFGRDLLRLLADTRTRRRLFEVIRLARRIKLFSQPLLLLLLRLPIHRSRTSKPRIIHREKQATNTKRNGQDSEQPDKHVPPTRRTMRLS
jgi:hypothetical protein